MSPDTGETSGGLFPGTRRCEKNCPPLMNKAMKLFPLLLPDPKRDPATVTAPLFYMFRALYAECRSHQAPEDVSDRIYRELSGYFYAHYPQADVFHAACRELHYSEAYLRRLFRQKSGKPPNAFLTQLRVKRAAELLRSTDQPVTRIAAACGFDDPNYFSALFHNWYGMPPRDYRKKKNALSP